MADNLRKTHRYKQEGGAVTFDIEIPQIGKERVRKIKGKCYCFSRIFKRDMKFKTHYSRALDCGRI